MGRALVVAAVLALALTASSARAVIVVQRSIGGVKLQMTKAQVRAKLGRPMRVRVGSNEFGTFVEKVYRRVTVTFQSGDRVTNVSTTSPLEQTASGVGVGSTKSQVKARVPTSLQERVRLQALLRRRVPAGTHRHRLPPSNGRVSSVSIGFVID